MASILSVSGSPSPTSRTARLLRHLDTTLAAEGEGEALGLLAELAPASGLLLLVSCLRLVQPLRLPQSTAAAMPRATLRGRRMVTKSTARTGS